MTLASQPATALRRSAAPLVREWHSNISAFIAPMVLFFATTGALQIFDLHESHDGYTAPKIVSAAARLHKQQIARAQPRREFDRSPQGGPPQGFEGRPGGDRDGRDGPQLSIAALALKWLFFVEAAGLVATTLLGVWIGVTHAKRRRTIAYLLAAGTLLPVGLVLAQLRGSP